jgi:hypothetical protein
VVSWRQRPMGSCRNLACSSPTILRSSLCVGLAVRTLTLLVLVTSAPLVALLPTLVPRTELPALLVNLMYPILDLVTLAIAIPALALFMKGTFWRPFLILVIGLSLALGPQVIFQVALLNGHTIQVTFRI